MDRFTAVACAANVRIVASGLPYRVGLVMSRLPQASWALFTLPQCSLRMRDDRWRNTRLRRAVFSVPAAARPFSHAPLTKSK